MAKHRKPSSDRHRPQPGASARPTGSELRVRKSTDVSGGEAWELVHPRCAIERADDMEEVQAMLEAGETEIAIDELRWLLSGCSDFQAAHLLLGTLALGEDRDVRLARGHFGVAFQLGIKALRAAGLPKPVPYRLPANQPLFEAGKGLAYCLGELGKPTMACEVLDQLLQFDPTDPPALAEMRGQFSGKEDRADEAE